MIRFARYVAVQAATYGLDMGLFLVLFALAGQGAVASNVAAKIAAGVFAFLAHRYVTFEAAREGRQARQAVLYVALWSLNVPLSTGLLALFLLTGFPAVIAKVLADAVCIGLNYWVSRNFIFVGAVGAVGPRTPAACSAAACPACGAEMHPQCSWVLRCRNCSFMASTLQPGSGRGVAGLRSLRLRNFETILDRLGELLPLKGASLLEVGCAAGWFLECALRRGMLVQGIEPEPDLADEASIRGLSIGAGFFPQALDRHSRYNVIVFNDVFEHLPEPADAIAEVERRLEPGGLAVLNLPSSEGVMFRTARLLNRLGIVAPYERLWQKGMDSPHVTYFNSRNLQSFVERRTALRLEYAGRLAALSRHGLWRRISSSWPRATSTVAFPVTWCASFVLDWCPSDIQLVIFRKEAAPVDAEGGPARPSRFDETVSAPVSRQQDGS